MREAVVGIALFVLPRLLLLFACQPSPEDRHGLGEQVDQLLYASRDLAGALVELDKFFSRRPEDLSAEEVERFVAVRDLIGVADYPSQDKGAIAARRDLLVAPPAEVIETVVVRMQDCDLTTYKGLCRASFAVMLLAEVSRGTFGWDPEIESSGAVRRNTLRVESWLALSREWCDSKDSDFSNYYGRKYGLGPPFVEVMPALAFGDVLRTEFSEEQSVEVRAALGFERIVQWKDGDGDVCEASLVLAPGYDLDKSYVGLAFPGGGLQWEECGGVRRIVLSEFCEAPGESAGVIEPEIEAKVQGVTLRIVIRAPTEK